MKDMTPDPAFPEEPNEEEEADTGSRAEDFENFFDGLWEADEESAFGDSLLLDQFRRRHLEEI